MTLENKIKIETELLTYNGEDKIISSYEMKEIIAKQPVTDTWVLKSSIPALDNLIVGFYPAEVTVISGVTGQGKTLLSQTMTQHFFLTGNNCLWFSYEVRAARFLNKFGIPMPEFYLPLKLRGQDMKWLKNRIYEAKLKYNIKAVFIDHLHYLLNLTTGHNVSLTIGDIMRQIFNIAHDLEIHIFLLSHMAKTKTEEPMLGDCRDSGMTEQEADNVFYVWRDLIRDNCGFIKIVKNREHGVFNKVIPIVKHGNYFVEDIYAADTVRNGKGHSKQDSRFKD